MPTAKKPSYISLELEWLEKKIKALQDAIDNYDLSDLKDRYGPKEMPNGRVVNAIISTREDQMKSVAFIMEKLPKMLASLDELRQKEEAAKIETRANTQMNGMMQNKFNQ